jgi:ABC-type Mn2+/Zn2+ transport system ATPase subunit
MNSISVEDLSVHLNNKRVLSNIYLNLSGGKVIGVVGPNGAGKSTLFKAILGLTEPTSGKILFNDKEIETCRSRIAYLPQKDQIDMTFPATVYDVVLMGRYAGKTIFKQLDVQDREKTEEAMSRMKIDHLRSRQIGELSGGQQQRVFLARALCQEADFLFLDEPFVGVDIITEEKTVETLKQLAEEGKVLLVVHHDLSTIASYFDQVIMINQRLIAFGDVRNTFIPENISETFGGQLTILQKAGLLHKK